MQLIILGTSAMVPTKTRNHSAIFLDFGPDGLLFDCGEGTQRQLKLAGIKLTKVNKIFISHWHGDHVLGLPGLLQSLAGEDYTKTMEIYGPKGSARRFEHLTQALGHDKTLKVKIIEKEGLILDTDKFEIHSKLLDHKIDSFGYSFIEKDRRRIRVATIKKLGIPEGPLLGKLQKGKSVTHKGKTIAPDEVTYIVKGKKITYIADTKLCKSAVELARDSDILICESTYDEADKEKAQEYNHMTSSDAAHVAQDSNSKKLILTHISQRYKDTTTLLKNAKKIFPETELAYDLMKIKI